MITLSRFNRLEALWDGIKQNNVVPDDLIVETEQNLLKNKIELSVRFCDNRIDEVVLRHKLAESYHTIALVDPLVKDSSLHLGQAAELFVVDPNGVVIACQSENNLGYCCPAAEMVNKNNKLKDIVSLGNIVQVNYDNGIRSQLMPIFNDHGEIQFFWGVADIAPITAKASNVLILAAQLLQERYKNELIIDEYTSSFMDAISEYAILLDEKGRIVNINEPCSALFKIGDPGILRGVPLSNLISHRSIASLNDLLDFDCSKPITIQLWNREIECHVFRRHLINTPNGERLLLLFNKPKEKAFNYLPVSTGSDLSAFDRIIGNSPEILQLKALARQSAASPATVLIQGESGTGKELFAQAIHQESGRPGVFVAINCGAIPSELIQSELFGYEEGAFTGARKRGCPGKFEIADGGTVFLDEIGEMPLDMQVNLLRFLQDKTVTRVGGNAPKRVDVRVIAATNRDLLKEVENGRFREDLYYRLDVIHLEIPALRKRRSDIPLIAACFLTRMCRQQGIDPLEISTAAMNTLMNCAWPGNARQLENAIERAFVLRHGKELNFDHLPASSVIIENSTRQDIEAGKDRLEKEAIEECLRCYRGNVSQAANAMGITRQTLHRKLKTLDIDRYDYIK